MRDSIRKITSKGWLTCILSLLILTDLFIIFKVPFLREVFSFLFITLVPGILIIQILRLDWLDFPKKVILWIGLSLSTLIFVGFSLNIVYPLIKSPLSLFAVLVALNLVVLILAISAYKRNQDDFYLGKVFNFQILSKNIIEGNLEGKVKDKLISPIIFPFLLPILAILGTYFMNQYENNTLIIITLLMIPVYLLVIVYLNKKVNSAVYPLSVWLISLTLLLLYGLTSFYPLGRDIHTEFYCFKLTLSNSYWNIYEFYNPYNACLSVTILPTVYQVISGIQAEYVFKLFFAIIGSFIPLSVYAVARKYLGKRYAFIAALLFVFQLFFANILGAVRQEIAIFYFFLAIMIVFDSDIDKFSKKLLFIIFIASTLVSHYSTAYVAFLLLLPILALPSLKTLLRERKISFTNWDVIIISLVILIVWYIFFAKVQFTMGAQAVSTTVAAVGDNTGLISGRGAYVLGILGFALKSLPNTISVLVHDAVFATIFIGFLSVIKNYRYFRQKFETEYIVAIILSVVLLVLFVVLPYISIAYDVSRLFFQLIIFLAPIFVIGCITLAKFLKKPRWDVWIMIILLISLFSCVTYLQYHFTGNPYSAIYEKDGVIRNEAYIYPSELVSAEWIGYKGENITIYSDGREFPRFSQAFGVSLYSKSINGSYFGFNRTVDLGYIYLGRVNVRDKKIMDIADDIITADLDDYAHLFESKSRIYDNGGSQIWW